MVEKQHQFFNLVNVIYEGTLIHNLEVLTMSLEKLQAPKRS